MLTSILYSQDEKMWLSIKLYIINNIKRVGEEYEMTEKWMLDDFETDMVYNERPFQDERLRYSWSKTMKLIWSDSEMTLRCM